VVSRHLVSENDRLRIVEDCESMFVPVLLYHHKQPFYTDLHKAVVEVLQTNCPPLLKP
jgi:hypothetical protein